MLFLVRLLTFLGVFWVLERLLRFFIAKRPPTSNPRSDGSAHPTDTVRDPVCGMYMDPRLAIRSPGKDGDLFFCSEDCRKQYSNK